MAINTLATATLFQKNLDKAIVAQLLTGYMDANAGQVKYNGGAEVKIPKMTMDGLGTYSRDNGYVQGGVTLTYETKSLTQDRGRKFQLDAMDVDETNFVATASQVMSEFQRTQVVPEVDAYRLSKLITTAITATNVTYGYTPASATILSEIDKAIEKVRENGYMGPLAMHASPATVSAINEACLGHLKAEDFSRYGINSQCPAYNEVPIIKTPANRMYSAITLKDGSTSGQTAGGYAKANTGKDCNFVVFALEAPIAVTKQDIMKIFTPAENQDADAWKMNYRRFHDLWVLDNKTSLVYANIKDAQ